PSTFDPATRLVRAQVPLRAIGPPRVDDGTIEAILLVGSTPGGSPPAVLLDAAPFLRVSQQRCELADLSSPLLRDLNVTDEFGGDHEGTDYEANGDSVFFMGDSGSVRSRGYDDRPLQRNARRDSLGLTRTGAGEYVTMRHRDGTVSKYFHLDSTSTGHITDTTTFVRGDFIGLADSTPAGGVTGSHLHVEYHDSTETLVDPHLCIRIADFGGRWTGTFSGQFVGPDTWTWDLTQNGSRTRGETFAPSLGVINGFVVSNRLEVLISYPSTGARNVGVVTLTGNRFTGVLTLITSTGFTTPFSTTMLRTEGPTPAAATAPDSRNGMLRPDGTASGKGRRPVLTRKHDSGPEAMPSPRGGTEAVRY
ncbi:MAG: M23 family metallopeptidase, partial [Gemmatimonadales bacterium]